ncbi:MAG TPA: ABC transporter permease [Desulfomonilaceae bacterium]|nr:ABC transporter permease [Desulfomonilaceae bacterium]
MRSSKWSYLWAVAVLLAVWQLGAWWAGESVLAGPVTVMVKLGSEAQSAKFWKHLGSSSLRIFAALVLSFVAAVPLGLFLGLSPRADRIARPLIYLTYPVPKIVLLPLVLLIFGLGDIGKIAMLCIILFFQLLITTRDAARGVSRAARYSLYSLGGTRRHLFLHVVWPSSLPAVFTALRIATGTVVAVLFFVESIGTRYGMGFYILDAWGRGDVPQIFVGIVVLALLGVILYETFDILERICCKWNQL